MAKTDSSVVPANDTLKYSIDMDAYDNATLKLEYLDVMLRAITCDGFAGFQTMCDKDQLTYLYAMSNVVDEVKACLK